MKVALKKKLADSKEINGELHVDCQAEGKLKGHRTKSDFERRKLKIMQEQKNTQYVIGVQTGGRGARTRLLRGGSKVKNCLNEDGHGKKCNKRGLEKK